MSTLPPCPKCQSDFTYEDEGLFVCPECAHEWAHEAAAAAPEQRVWKDANGNVLQDGDHDIDCKIDGFGPMQLKTEFVKKA
ncbi:MAG: hypothetical protein RL758_481 [Pseudomonadota bacterium]|jgi:protein PhnA